jgi:hypothetical protein
MESSLEPPIHWATNLTFFQNWKALIWSKICFLSRNPGFIIGLRVPTDESFHEPIDCSPRDYSQLLQIGCNSAVIFEVLKFQNYLQIYYNSLRVFHMADSIARLLRF